MLSPCGSKLFTMFHFDTAAYMSKMLVVMLGFLQHFVPLI